LLLPVRDSPKANSQAAALFTIESNAREMSLNSFNTNGFAAGATRYKLGDKLWRVHFSPNEGRYNKSPD